MARRLLVPIIVLALAILLSNCTSQDLPPEPGAPGAIGQAGVFMEGYANSQGFMSLNKDVFSLAQGDSTDLSVSVFGDDLVYGAGYILVNGAWELLDYEGNYISGTNWIKGDASFIFDLSYDVFPSGTYWVLAYGCTREAGAWNCHNGQWMISEFSVEEDIALPVYGCTDNSLIGDANGDGVVDLIDITFMLSLVNVQPNPSINICCIDLDNDGFITEDDVLIMQELFQGDVGSLGTCANPIVPVNEPDVSCGDDVCTYNLYPGFNSITIPFEDAGTAEDLLLKTNGACVDVYKLVPQGWTRHGLGGANNFDIEPLEGYRVECDSSATITFSGVVDAVDNINVTTGYNLVGITQELQGKTFAELAPGCAPSTVNELFLDESDIEISPNEIPELGLAYMLLCTQNGIWGITCGDSDDGLDYEIYGWVSDAAGGTHFDGCQDLVELNERTCVDGVMVNNYVTCEYGCSIGVCKKVGGNDNTTGVMCASSDGKDYFVAGQTESGVVGNPGINYDHCQSPTSLFESYCENGYYASEEYECPFGCENGVCIPEPDLPSGP